MRSDVVVVFASVGKHHSGLAYGVENNPIETLDSESAFEALGIPVLPRTTGVNVDGLDLVFSQPVPDYMGDELGPVVATDELGWTVLFNGLLEQPQRQLRPGLAPVAGRSLVPIPG